jgi:LuxR family transcriptional regulator, quorum-sensing system regulator CciR
MIRFEVAQEFIERTQVLQNEDELFRLMEEVTIEMGFRYFALINHIDLRHTQKNVIHFDNYPISWATYFTENGLYTQDPVLRASLTSNVGFPWIDVPKMIEITSRQRSILERAAKNGLGDGYTVPANIPGERCGSCSFATRRGLAAPVKNFPLAHLIGGFAFQAARRLNQADSMPQQLRSHLTQRQRDCLLWAIKGKTDWEIGRILGLKKETVSEYLETARERYGVTKRLPLAIHAIFDGQISFIEALF